MSSEDDTHDSTFPVRVLLNDSTHGDDVLRLEDEHAPIRVIRYWIKYRPSQLC